MNMNSEHQVKMSKMQSLLIQVIIGSSAVILVVLNSVC